MKIRVSKKYVIVENRNKEYINDPYTAESGLIEFSPDFWTVSVFDEVPPADLKIKKDPLKKIVLDTANKSV